MVQNANVGKIIIIVATDVHSICFTWSALLHTECQDTLYNDYDNIDALSMR